MTRKAQNKSQVVSKEVSKFIIGLDGKSSRYESNPYSTAGWTLKNPVIFQDYCETRANLRPKIGGIFGGYIMRTLRQHAFFIRI